MKFSFGGSSGSAPSDKLGLQVIRQIPLHIPTFMGLMASIAAGLPQRGLPEEVNRWRRRNRHILTRGTFNLALASLRGIPHFYGVLHLRKICQDGLILDYGIASHQLITTVGCNRIVDTLRAFDTVATTFKYHAFGSGATAPAIGDTALQTEYTTEYNPDNTRPTGSQLQGGSNNVYRTVGTYTPDASCTVSEMGLLSQAAKAAASQANTILDRFTFTGIPLNGTGDALQTTVDITFPAGS